MISSGGAAQRQALRQRGIYLVSQAYNGASAFGAPDVEAGAMGVAPGASAQRQLRLGAWPGYSPQRQLRLGSYGGDWVSVVTPADLQARAAQINAYILGLNDDAMNATAMDGSTAAQFAQFAQAWASYYDSLGGVTGWFKRLWGTGTSNTLDSYQTQADAWARVLGKAGARITAPAPPPPPAPGPDTGSTLRTVAIAGAIIVGGFVLLRAFDFIPGGHARAHAGHGRRTWRGYGGHGGGRGRRRRRRRSA